MVFSVHPEKARTVLGQGQINNIELLWNHN